MKVIIIGNGVAGNTASATIRRLDAAADITIISEEIYPEYSACALPRYLAGELRRQKLFLKTKKDYSRERVKTILGQKVSRVSLEEKMVFLDTRSLAFDKLIMATGSKPMMLPIKGVNLEGVFTLKSLDDADRILNYPGKAAVIIGSGPVGVETGIALAKRGLRVHVIELLDRIMPRVFDERPASRLREILEKHGIKVVTGEMVTSIAGNNKVEGIVTRKQTIECDMVILGAGMKPNIELAQKAGLGIGTLGGVSVTRQMLTNSPDIYAGGDCVEAEDRLTGGRSLCLLWHNAKSQGEVIGYNCCGIPRSYPGLLNITSLDIFGISATSFGHTEAEASQNKDIEVVERFVGENYYRLILQQGKLIGAQSVGNARDIGALLFLLMGQHDFKEIKQVVGRRALPPLSPWYYTVARYIGGVVSEK